MVSVSVCAGNFSAEGVFCLQAGRVFHHSRYVRAVAAR